MPLLLFPSKGCSCTGHGRTAPFSRGVSDGEALGNRGRTLSSRVLRDQFRADEEKGVMPGRVSHDMV